MLKISNFPRELPNNKDVISKIIQIGVTCIRNSLSDALQKNPDFKLRMGDKIIESSYLGSELGRLQTSLNLCFRTPSNIKKAANHYFVLPQNAEGKYQAIEFNIKENQSPEDLWNEFRLLLESCGVIENTNQDSKKMTTDMTETFSQLNNRITSLENRNRELKNRNRELENRNRELESFSKKLVGAIDTLNKKLAESMEYIGQLEKVINDIKLFFDRIGQRSTNTDTSTTKYFSQLFYKIKDNPIILKKEW